VRGLDDGIKKLGPLVTLELCAVDIEVKDKQYDAALARLDLLAAKSPRKESWLARRGDILLQAGKTEEARKAFQTALDAMETLPPARRNVPAMLELQTRLREQLAKLKQ
jgi:predicted negative regulator of RcsB-dependent stress response